MEEYKSKELEQFKKLLQYFLLHLEYNNFEKLKNEGKILTDFSWPNVDEKIKRNIIKGRKTGQGYDDYKIQDQIEDWCNYHVGKICISVQHSRGGGYTSTASYLHWTGTGLNINAKWNDDKKKIDCLYYRDVDATDVSDDLDNGPQFSISRDDLLGGDSSQLENLYNHYIRVKNESLKKLLEKSHNIILTGAPGTGKTYLAKQIAEQVGAKGERCGFVQFHPSYDYTDFVEGLRPTTKDKQGTIVFERKDGVFKAFCAEAAIAEKVDTIKPENEKRKFVFIIDEINRGEISKIFGELFFSIDPGYRGEFDDKQNDNKVKTQYQNLIDTDDTLSDDDSIIKNKDKQQDNITYYPFKKGFYVPKNVYVIGTMNDIDRSVESLDFAFRRRFTFHEITAEDSARIIYSADSKDGWDFPKQQNAVCRMKALNNAIVDNDKGGLTEQHKIGGAYFLKLKDVGFNFNRLWNEYLRGILFEYLRGLPQKDIDKKLKELKNAYDTKNNDLKTQDTNTDSDSQNS